MPWLGFLLRYHEAELKVLAGSSSCLEALEGNLFQLHSGGGQIQSLAAAGRGSRFPCSQSAAAGCSQALSAEAPPPPSGQQQRNTHSSWCFRSSQQTVPEPSRESTLLLKDSCGYVRPALIISIPLR